MGEDASASNAKTQNWEYAAFAGVVTFYAVLFSLVRNDAFFGDAISTVSRAAWHITHSNFNEIAYPPGLDPGHPITFPLLYALVWKLFDVGLPQSHAINFIFSMGITGLAWLWVKNELGRKQAWFAVLLLLCVPIFVANTAQMNTHLPLTFFVLGLGYALKFNNKIGQILFSTGLLITHLQGLYFLVPLWIWWFFSSGDLSIQQKIRHGLNVMAIPVLCYFLWLFYHHQITGWWLSSPDYAGHRGFAGIKRVLINLVLSDWRMVDYGQVALFFVPMYVLFKQRFILRQEHTLSLFFAVYIFNALAISVTTQTGPAHRYLLPCIPFLVMANVQFFDRIKKRWWFVVLLVLVSGNWWFYPGKVLGDATLSNRSINGLIAEVKSDFPNQTMFSYAPLSNASIFTRLTKETNDFQPLYDFDMDSVDFVIRSNISGDFPASQVRELQENWPVKTYEKGYVYVEVYANPKTNSEAIKQSNKRVIGGVELWMLEMKKKIKGEDAH